jgi:hypothetical protein
MITHGHYFCLTRKSSATAGGSEVCFHSIFHNSSITLSVRRPAVGSCDWLDAWGRSRKTHLTNIVQPTSVAKEITGWRPRKTSYEMINRWRPKNCSQPAKSYASSTVKIPSNNEAPLAIAKSQKKLRPVRMKAKHQRPNKYRFATANETATDKRTAYKSGGIRLTRRSSATAGGSELCCEF